MADSPSPTLPRVCMIQDGARRHYGVPLSLQKAEILDLTYTEWFASPGSLESLIARAIKPFKPALAKRMGERFVAGLDATKIRTKPTLVFDQIRGQKKFSSDVEYYAWMSQRTGGWILRRGFAKCNVLYGFVRNVHPTVCATARQRGLKVVTDQIIAPFTIEHAEALKQQARFPGWGKDSATTPQPTLVDFERQTWDQSDTVICASEYVRDGLIAQGVDPKKIAVVPYPYNMSNSIEIDRAARPDKTITVGFVGQVGMRKGAPYVFEIAKRFDPAKVRFVMIGNVAIDPTIVEKHRGAVELPGPVSRRDVQKWLETFDMFLFPSTCEGSAGSVIEAMAARLPVVTSPNSGSLVRHGVDGFVAPYDDIDQLAGYIDRLAADRELRLSMGLSARTRVTTFDLARYGQTVREICTSLLAR